MARTREFDTASAVAAATEVFRRHGYAGSSLRELSAATGLGSGSLYAAFGSKDGLYLAALDDYRARYAHELVDRLNAETDPVAAVRSVMTDAVAAMVVDARERACLIVGAAAECAHASEQVAEHVGATLDSLRRAFARAIAEARQDGRVIGSRSTDELASFLVAALQGLRVMAAVDSDENRLHQVASVATDAIFGEPRPPT